MSEPAPEPAPVNAPEPVPAPAPRVVRDVRALHAEAMEVSIAARHFVSETDFGEMTKFIDEVGDEQLKLMDSILEKLENAVLSAAAGGGRSATVLEFRGGDIFDKYSTLFMLLGGHDPERRRDLESYGFEPLMSKIRDAVKPFRLTHEWDRETNKNALVVTW